MLRKEYPQIKRITQSGAGGSRQEQERQGQEQRAGAGIIGQFSFDIYQLSFRQREVPLRFMFRVSLNDN